MSFNIKEKLDKLIHRKSKDEGYVYLFSLNGAFEWLLLPFIIIFIPKLLSIPIFQNGPINNFSAFISMVATMVVLISIIFIFALILFIIVVSFSEESLCLACNDTIILYQKDIDLKFGSVNRAFEIYEKLEELNLNLTDDNFELFIKESPIINDKIKLINNRLDCKLSKIDNRINKLIEQKKVALNKSNDKLKNIPELKDFALSTTGGLK